MIPAYLMEIGAIADKIKGGKPLTSAEYEFAQSEPYLASLLDEYNVKEP